MSEINLKLQVPITPIFITIEGLDSIIERQDGIIEKPRIDIANIPDEQLIRLADEWKAALLADAHYRRNNK